jgi:hypothetical protein
MKKQPKVIVGINQANLSSIPDNAIIRFMGNDWVANMVSKKNFVLIVQQMNADELTDLVYQIED